MESKIGCVDPDTASAKDEFSLGRTRGQEIDGRALFGSSTAVLIRHGEEAYALRKTRAGKLVQTT
ncbi:MAG: hemin uptake protein HemP [Pseudomonadota bacterium]